MIQCGCWKEGRLPLHQWVMNDERYDFRWGTVENNCGWLEEQLTN